MIAANGASWLELGDIASSTTPASVIGRLSVDMIRSPLPGTTKSRPAAAMLPPSSGMTGIKLRSPTPAPPTRSPNAAGLRPLTPGSGSDAHANEDRGPDPDLHGGPAKAMPACSYRLAGGPAERGVAGEDVERDLRLGPGARVERMAELVSEGEACDRTGQPPPERPTWAPLATISTRKTTYPADLDREPQHPQGPLLWHDQDLMLGPPP